MQIYFGLLINKIEYINSQETSVVFFVEVNMLKLTYTLQICSCALHLGLVKMNDHAMMLVLVMTPGLHLYNTHTEFYLY